MPKPKMLYFLINGGLAADPKPFMICAPGVTSDARAEALLSHKRKKKPDERFDLFAASQDNMPGWKALGDKLTDEQLFDGHFGDEDDAA